MFSFLKHPPTPKHHQPKLAAVSVASAQFKFVVGEGNLYFPWQQDGKRDMETTFLPFGEPTASSTPTPLFFITLCICALPCCCMCAVLFLTWLRLSLMAAAHSSGKSGHIFSHVLSNDIKKSGWEGRRGDYIIGWLASRWPKKFSGTSGRLLRSLKEH